MTFKTGIMSSDDISKDISDMWVCFRNIAEKISTCDDLEPRINDALLDMIAKNNDPDFGSPVSLSAFANFLKFMVWSYKDGLLFQPTKDRFTEWFHK